MTHDGDKPAPEPYIDEDDLVYLAADMGAGYFPVADLYRWHTDQVGETGRLPVSKKRFGMTLKAHGWHNAVRTVCGKQVRCWLINKPWARRGQEMLAAEKAAYDAEQVAKEAGKADSEPST